MVLVRDAGETVRKRAAPTRSRVLKPLQQLLYVTIHLVLQVHNFAGVESEAETFATACCQNVFVLRFTACRDLTHPQSLDVASGEQRANVNLHLSVLLAIVLREREIKRDELGEEWIAEQVE